MKDFTPNRSRNMRDFLALPNPLVERILLDGLTGVEIKVLLLCVRWTVGYDKPTCTPSLTALSNKTGHARKFLSRVLKSLVEKQYLQLMKPSGFRRPAEYKVLLEWDSPTGVGQSKCNQHSGESHGSRTGNPTGVGQGVPREYPSESHCRGHYIDSFHKSPSIESKNQKPPLKVPQGDIAESAKNALPASASTKPSLRSSTLSGDGVPLPREATPQKQKLDIKPYVRLFQAEIGHDPSLTKTEVRNFEKLVAGCNRNLFAIAFSNHLTKIKGEPFPDNLRRPGDVFNLLAVAAANEANANGAAR